MNKKCGFKYICIIFSLCILFGSCTQITNDAYISSTEVCEKIINSDSNIGYVTVYVKDYSELKTIGNVLRLKNGTGLEIKLDLSLSSINKIGTVFQNCQCLTYIKLPNTIDVIDSNAFMGCDKLESFNVPEDVKEIKEKAFYNCLNLKYFNFNGNKISKIGYSAFVNCTNLNNFSIPESIKVIEPFAFANCQNIKFSVYGNQNWTTDDEVTTTMKLNNGYDYVGDYLLTRE